MDVKLLELNFAQLSRAWNKSKFNNYSDNRKQAYRDRLASLFNKLQAEDFSNLSPTQVKDRSYIIDFFFTSLQFLDSSTLNLIPFEIVECLGESLKEWIDPHQDFIIVTSLVNEPLGFSFNPNLAFNNFLYTNIKTVYNEEFPQRLIQITLPRFLVRDYLANVVLYHELGHFIDVKYNIASAIHNYLCNHYFNNALNPQDKADVQKYFPYIENYRTYFLQKQLPPTIFYHLREYFSDIFASQYIGECSNYYLDYITKKQAQHGEEHPSTINRVDIVNKFLKSDTSSYTLNLILSATQQITNRDLSIRYSRITNNEFYNLLPCVISNEQQLHSLFILGWETWLDDWNKISAINNMQFQIDANQVYNIINNLIEKSINSFIVTKSWEKANAIAEESN
ncbi:hypothetical protein AAE02nite_32790 [Adhaeribacter aerolatus]|uniref:Uncharacterized protein n=1 Tax=Adhaeribacter aerolatus TaxID=670289 RepID=A0A512B0X6_9BACT|nr:hypothetical protein [Adhaeribacter aerolatus]GEO05615.1 hypothetical protein AAE02nite_32790 [Adhaeribacter aerolatus]